VTNIEERTVHNRQSKQGLNKLLEWEKGSDDLEVLAKPVPTYEKRDQSRNAPVSSLAKVLLNKQNLEKILSDKLNRYGLNAKGNYNEIFNSLNNGLEFYLKNILERLVQINRARNVNLNLYSKYSEKDPMFKIHTFNYKPSGHMVELVPYHDFSIVFTKNMKSEINTIEHYEELMAYKSKIEKISTYKTKIEELHATANKPVTVNKQENNIAKQTKQPRQRRRATTILKNYKNAVAKTQKKNEIDRQKKDTQYTLQTFLDNKPSNIYRSKVRLFNKRIVFLAIE
jgi:hypothetical protein